MNRNVTRLMVLALLASFSCTDNGQDDDGSTESDGESGETDSGGDPGEACADLPPLPPSSMVVTYPEQNDGEILQLPTADCPATADEVPPEEMEITVQTFRPAVVDDGPWPASPFGFPLVVFEHGNGQDGTYYSDLMSLMTQRGMVVANILSDPVSFEKSRSARISCVAASLASTFAWTGTPHLSGDIVLMGHSTGGQGAVRAADDLIDIGFFDNTPDIKLKSVVSIAPSCEIDSLENVDPIQIGSVPWFGVQGSRDGDTDNCVFWLRDQVSKPEEGLQPPTAPRVTVFAYNLLHRGFGGQFISGISPLAMLLYQEYMIRFLDIELFDAWAARSRFFETGLEVPPIFSDETLWPTFEAGYPFVFGSVTDRSGDGFSRFVIDAFESGGPGISTHGVGVSWDQQTTSVTEVDPMVPVTGQSDTRAMAISASAGSEVSWEVAPELRDDIAASASYVSLRISVPGVPDDDCVPQVPEVPPIYISLADETSSSTPVLLNDYADLSPGDVWFGLLSCQDRAPFQSSIRVPLADFCAGSELLLDELSLLTLTFEQDTQIVIDSLEIGGSPGDPSRADCKCLI